MAPVGAVKIPILKHFGVLKEKKEKKKKEKDNQYKLKKAMAIAIGLNHAFACMVHCPQQTEGFQK